jgi:hypothetical protein
MWRAERPSIGRPLRSERSRIRRTVTIATSRRWPAESSGSVRGSGHRTPT